MDTKSRSNDPNADEIKEVFLAKDEKITDVKRTDPKKYSVTLFIFVCLLLAVGLFGCRMIKAKGYSFNQYWRNQYGGQEDMQRFAKNINRFFIHYGGYAFETLSDEEKYELISKDDTFTEDTISTLMTEQMKAEQETEMMYNEKINNSMYESTREFETLNSIGSTTVYNVDANLVKEKQQALENIRKEYSLKISQAKESARLTMVQEANQNYFEIKNYLERKSPFEYYLYNTKDAILYTNIQNQIFNGNLNNYSGQDIDNYIQQHCLISISLDDPMIGDVTFNGRVLGESFYANHMQGYLMLPTTKRAIATSEGNYYYEMVQRFNDAQNRVPFYMIALFGSIVSMVLLFIIKKSFVASFLYGLQYFYIWYKKIPLVLKGLGFLLFMSYFYRLDYNPSIFLYYNISDTFMDIFFTSGWFALLFVMLKHVVCFFKNPKILLEEPEIKGIRYLSRDLTYINKCGHGVCIFAFYSSLLLVIIIAFVALAAIYSIGDGAVALFILFCFAIGFFMYTLFIRFLVSFCKLQYYIQQLYEGKDPIFVSEKGLLKTSMDQLNDMKKGLTESIHRTMKSERMKAELITNVSHDLKTPLTSIINYVALLRKEGLQSNRAPEYLDILDAKTQRLKLLIEDLFEASKLSSGTMELALQKVNIVDLMNQTLGELNEKIEHSHIDFKLHYNKEPIYLNIDGKKMWRVFDNLIQNIIKYAQPHTRAYLHIEEENSTVVITFRNTSNYEMRFDATELVERFKRADESRSTEGSGLGLSIAQSIVLLHGGTMDIVTDGDLFKVVLQFYQK